MQDVDGGVPRGGEQVGVVHLRHGVQLGVAAHAVQASTAGAGWSASCSLTCGLAPMRWGCDDRSTSAHLAREATPPAGARSHDLDSCSNQCSIGILEEHG